MKHFLFALMLVSACLPVAAEPFNKLLDDASKARANGRAITMFEVDNDSLLLKRDDGFYTNGVRLTRQYALHDAAGLTISGWRLGQDLYTPMNARLRPALVGPPDHPYAAWLYGGMFLEKHRRDGTHTTFGLDIGCLGPCAGGKWTQTNLHRVLNQPLPRGWSKQVRNEVGAVLRADVAPVRWNAGASVDVTPNLHARFGNIFTDAGAGATLRAGRLNNLPYQDALYGFLRIDGRAVGHDATLQGGYFSKNNPHTVRPKRLVGETEAGVMWQHATFGVSFSVVRRGNEIRDLPDATGAQNFVRLLFSYNH